MGGHRRTGGDATRGGSAEVLFDRVGTTLFYRPVSPGPGERLWFLHWRTESPRPQIALKDTWADTGTPPAVGYFVFFDTLPPDSAAAEVEAALRALWKTPPVASGFAWVRYQSGKAGKQRAVPESSDADSDARAWWRKDKDSPPSLVAVSTRLALILDESSRPTVEADTPFTLPPGQLTFGFADGAMVFGTRSDGVSLDGFMVTFPPLIGADPPTGGRSLALPMTGPAVGCVRFDALVNQPARAATRAKIDEAAKTLVHVQIDPLHPFDPARTFQTFTNRHFLLRRTAGGFQLIPAPAGA